MLAATVAQFTSYDELYQSISVAVNAIHESFCAGPRCYRQRLPERVDTANITSAASVAHGGFRGYGYGSVYSAPGFYGTGCLLKGGPLPSWLSSYGELLLANFRGLLGSQ